MNHQTSDQRFQAAYRLGQQYYREGRPDVNPYGLGNLLEMCAWSSGYFDDMRGMI